MTTPASEKITCPHCGKLTSTETGFCDECGLELATQALKPVTAAQIMATGKVAANDKLTCPFCGHKLRPGARHCPNCGKKLTNVDAAPKEVKLEGPPSALKVGLLVAAILPDAITCAAVTGLSACVASSRPHSSQNPLAVEVIL